MSFLLIGHLLSISLMFVSLSFGHNICVKSQLFKLNCLFSSKIWRLNLLLPPLQNMFDCPVCFPDWQWLARQQVLFIMGRQNEKKYEQQWGYFCKTALHFCTKNFCLEQVMTSLVTALFLINIWERTQEVMGIAVSNLKALSEPLISRNYPHKILKFEFEVVLLY